MISDAITYEGNPGLEMVPSEEPLRLKLPLGLGLTEKELKLNFQERKQRRVRDLLASFNRLSTALFSGIDVAERQTAVLQDLHRIFSISYSGKTKDFEKECPLRKNPLIKKIGPIPIVSENPEQMWPSVLDTVDEISLERKCFIKKVGVLVENMQIKREIV